MTRVVLVDWLGRGGIAQTSESWAMEFDRAGIAVEVLTRSDRELGAGIVPTSGPPERRTAVGSHVALCRFAAERIRLTKPDVVIIQNHVIPALEIPVHRAARTVGARVIFVVHDHRHHEWREGLHLGLGHLIERADRVVAHSRAVAAGIGRADVELLPLPVQLRLVDLPGRSVIDVPDDGLLALQVGILNRSYKGTDTGIAIATAGAEGWSFGFAGVGAPTVPGAQSVDRFLEPGELWATVASSDAVILPYRHATQSGAVALAQVCGTVPVASAVDGVTEQIVHGRTGLLLPPGAGIPVWQDALRTLRDDDVRAELKAGARAAAWANHAEFVAGALALVSPR